MIGIEVFFMVFHLRKNSIRLCIKLSVRSFLYPIYSNHKSFNKDLREMKDGGFTLERRYFLFIVKIYFFYSFVYF